MVELTFFYVSAEREEAVKTKARLMTMKGDKDAYLGDLLKERKAAFDKKLSDFNKNLDKERVRAMAARKEQRKNERRQKVRC